MVAAERQRTLYAGALRVDGLLRGLMLPVSRLVAARDFRPRHRGAGVERRDDHIGEHECFGGVRGQYACLCGPPDPFSWSGIL
jgi:hypothetical protein